MSTSIEAGIVVGIKLYDHAQEVWVEDEVTFYRKSTGEPYQEKTQGYILVDWSGRKFAETIKYSKLPYVNTLKEEVIAAGLDFMHMGRDNTGPETIIGKRIGETLYSGSSGSIPEVTPGDIEMVKEKLKSLGIDAEPQVLMYVYAD